MMEDREAQEAPDDVFAALVRDVSEMPMEERYRIWRIPKRTGGLRTIEAPCDKLKMVQRCGMLRMERKYRAQAPFGHAFRHGRSVATMAANHVGKRYVMKADLSDFFPSIKLDTAAGLIAAANFQQVLAGMMASGALGARELAMLGVDAGDESSVARVARGIALEASKFEDVRDRNSVFKKYFAIYKEYYAGVVMDLAIHFHDFQDGKGMRLPQGAPASPLISNLVMYDLDWQLAWMAHKKGVVYSRYADDLVFSTDKLPVEPEEGQPAYNIPMCLRSIYEAMGGLLQGKGFTLNEKKCKVIPAERRQMVCGVVVNKDLRLPRRWRRNLRAALHQRGLHPERAARGGKYNPANISGRLAYQHMVQHPPEDVRLTSDMLDTLFVSRQA